MKNGNETVIYNPEEDFKDVLLLGTFPGHVVGMERGQKHLGSTPFNGIFKVADEAREMTGVNWRDENKVVSAEGMVGQLVRGTGIWFNPKPDSQSSNRPFFQKFQAMGVEFKQVKNKGFELREPEEDEVLGAPVLFTIGLETAKRDRGLPDDQATKFPKVFDIRKWDEGERLSKDDIIKNPFGDDEDSDDDATIEEGDAGF
jgi:hypothetical protein